MSNPEVSEVVSRPCVFCGNATVAEKELVEGEIWPWPYPVCYLCLSKFSATIGTMLIAASNIVVVWRSFLTSPSFAQMEHVSEMVSAIRSITAKTHEHAIKMGDMRYVIEEIKPLPEIGKYETGDELGILLCNTCHKTELTVNDEDGICPSCRKETQEKLREYARRMAVLKPKLGTTAIAVGVIGGALFFSALASPFYHYWAWAIAFFGGMLSGLVGLQVALADRKERMQDWELTKRMTGILEKMPSQGRPT